MGGMKLFTIGFTRKSAEQFFAVLSEAGVQRVIDIRLNNVSQLAGFAKRDDLRFFLGAICSIACLHRPDLAPSKALLETYRKGGDWDAYRRGFLELIAKREIEKHLPRALMADSCLLCSEEAPDHCHRRLVAEYLANKWGDIEIIHLR